MTTAQTPIEVEARLMPPAGGSGRGEIEYEVHFDGGQSLECSVHGLQVPKGTVVSVLQNGQLLGQITVSGFFRRSGRIDLSTRRGDAVPALAVGDRIEVVAGSESLLSGTTHPD